MADDRDVLLKVKKYEVLYNSDHRDFENVIIKNNIWKKISAELKMPVYSCKIKWTILSSIYLQILTQRSSNSGTNTIKYWRYESHMEFFRPYLEKIFKWRIKCHQQVSPSLTTSSLGTAGGGGMQAEESSLTTQHMDNSGMSATDTCGDECDVPTNPEVTVSSEDHDRHREERSTDVNRHELMVFFANIAESISKFSGPEQASVKREIFMLVASREIDNLSGYHHRLE